MAGRKGRRNFSREFKARVARDTMRDVETVSAVAARHQDFRVCACRPRRPRIKGKVERPVRRVRDGFLVGGPSVTST